MNWWRAIDVALDLKKKLVLNEGTFIYCIKSLFLLFFFFLNSLKNFVSAAMDHLGGNSHDLPSDKLPDSAWWYQLKKSEKFGVHGRLRFNMCSPWPDWQEGNKYITEAAVSIRQYSGI